MDLPPIALDKIKGLLIGLAVGDALGCAYEYTKNMPYTGVLDGSFNLPLLRRGTYTLPQGHTSNITELALMNARNMLINPQLPWQRDKAIESYLIWSASQCYWNYDDMKIFSGIKTIPAYNKRYNELYSQTPSNHNGSLCRAIPLAIVKTNQFAYEDALLTHINPDVLNATMLYVDALRLAMWDCELADIIDNMGDKSQRSDLQQALLFAMERQPVDVSGKYQHDYYVPFYILTRCVYEGYSGSYENAVDYTIANYLHSDVRTNAAFVGAMMGASLGYDALTMESKTAWNIDKVLNTVTGRHEYYSLTQFDDLCQQLHQRYGL